MMQNSKILLPLDFSDTGEYAMKAALKLADLFDGSITPFHAYMPISDLYSPGMYGLETTSVPAADPAEMEKMHEESLREAVQDDLPAEKINEYIITMGKADQAITEAANDFDLIVMGSHGRSGFSRFFMGSVSDKVLRTAHIPVLVVNENQQFRPIRRIMVTTDFSDYSKEAFPITNQIAKKTDAAVEVVHILSFNARDKKAPDETVENTRRQRLEVIVKEHFHELEDKVKPRLIISSDSAHEAIINDNLNNPHDLIVMAAVGRTGIEHLTMGSTASKVVRHVKSPVLSVNPKINPKTAMHKTAAAAIQVFLFVLLFGFMASCFAPTPTSPEPKPDPPGKENPPEIDTISDVPADGVLETVTWNLEWYGHSFGPENKIKQTKNLLTIIDTLDADLYAFQEVSSDDTLSSEESLMRLVSHMKGYRGFVAKGIRQSQKTAFVYNRLVIDSLSSGLIKQNQDFHDWASGRYPFYFKFNYTSKDTTITIYAVVIHAKAGDGAEDYNRRKDAAQSLYNYLVRNKPKANIIFLGDYNDDVDVSIYEEKVSPYKPFIRNDKKFRVITKSLSMKGQATTVSYPDAVDHITMSNELYEEYILGSEKALTEAAALIKNYGETTSDHYPVWAKFEF